MKKLLLLSIALLFLGCEKEAQSSEILGKDIKVEFLFEKDGVRVYRFYDGRTHYFTNRGETISTQTYQSGKHTYTEGENIN